jgi:predicted O-methyltransferase YrrM
MEKFWNIPPQTGVFLNMLVKAMKCRKVLEVGTSNGYSGLWLAEALSHTGGKLYTVESHRERFVLAEKNFKAAGLTGFIEQIFGHAPEVFSTSAFRARGLKFDFIFIDATKVEYASYLKALLPFLKPGGVLVADNAISHRTELGAFFAFLEKNHSLQSVLLPIGSGLMMSLK